MDIQSKIRLRSQLSINESITDNIIHQVREPARCVLTVLYAHASYAPTATKSRARILIRLSRSRYAYAISSLNYSSSPKMERLVAEYRMKLFIESVLDN